jgi:putative CocE/NonD family hydrolase
LVAQIRKERGAQTLGKTSSVVFKEHPFRDSIMRDGTSLYEDRASLYRFIDRINRSGIPIYMTTGWYDLFAGDMFFWYNTLTTPKRLIVLPVDHSEIEGNQYGLDFSAEAHRWFDRWLKGIKNGIMEEAPIHYYAMNTSKTEAWQTADQWPLEKEKSTRFYFGPGKIGNVDSVNDGLLTTEFPTVTDAFDQYSADYTTTSGSRSRWTAVNWPRDYPDMRSNDEKALTFTTPPLENDLEVTGHPVVHLWLSTDARDLDVFVYLEEVDRSGRSTYITEGNIRASHRKLSQPPFENMGLPYHSHAQSDVAEIPEGAPVQLVFALLPTSYRFQEGSRVRIATVCADADNFDTSVVDPAPELHLLRGTDHPSFVQLPVAQ